MEELESLKQQLEELKKLRNELSVTEEKITQEENSTDLNSSLRSELDKIDLQIKELETEVKKTAKEYEASYKKLQAIIDEYKEKTEATKLLSQEEIEELIETTEKLKLEENERSNEIKSKLDAQKKIIKELKAKKTRIENNIRKAEALGLSIEEYREITQAINKTTIMNAILEKKGLSSIIDKKASERTKEEKELLKAAKKEVLDEISQVKRANEEYSVLDAIEALYSLEVTYKEVKKPRVIEIKKNELQVIKENSSLLPYRIITSKTINREYTPEETPEDMKEAMDNNSDTKVDLDNLKPAEERVTLFKDKETDDYYVRKYTVNRFKLTSADFANEVRINGSVCYKINAEDVEKIKNNANNAFSPYITSEKEVTIEKPLIEAEVVKNENTPLIPANVVINEQEDNNNEEKVTIYKDVNSNDYYVKKYVANRFKLKSAEFENEKEIDGNVCQKISIEDVGKLVENADNTTSPYEANIKEIELDSEKELQEDDIKELFDESLGIQKEESLSREDIEREIDEKIENYMKDKKSAEEEEKLDSEEEIEEIPYEETLKELNIDNDEIAEDDIKSVFDESLNSSNEEEVETTNDDAKEETNTNPYKVDASALGDKEEYYDNLLTEADNKYIKASQKYQEALVVGTKDDIKKAKEELDKATKEYIELSQHITDLLEGKKDKKPADKKGLSEMFKEPESGKKEEVKTEPAKKGLSEMFKEPESDKKKEEKTPSKIDTGDSITSNKYAETSVEAIIYKLTKDLDIKAKDGKRFVASNIKVASNFKKELKSGNFLYNIVHVVPSAISFVASTARKLTSKLLLGVRGKKVCAEIAKRMESLSETELKTLFDKYKGNRLKADMNNQINPLILDGLRKYALAQVEKYNETIKKSYVELFASLEEVKAIDKKLSAKGLSEESKKAYLLERKKAMKKAADSVRTIENSYDKANELLSSGLHGIEEDFKAVATKLSYVGLRFTKEHDFNNELQKQLAEADVKLAEGLATNDDEKIVDGYMAKERIYYENTEVGYSLLGKRSKGEKYYTPYVERLDYRQDPFIRDLLTTVATTTAVISAVNAYRVHQVETAPYINAQNAEAARVNAMNDKLLSDIGDQASQIVAGRETIRKGLVAQMNQDVTNVAHGAERTALDTVNWTTGTSTYRALDDANHAMYNAFYDNITSEINGIVNRCAQGSITQAQATEELLALSSGAQDTFIGVAQGCLDQLRIYAPAHPQFDLHATEEALQYIVNNPTAITDMNTTAVNATNIAEGLVGLSPEHVQALSYLPSDWTSTMIHVAGSVALIDNIARNMKTRETDNSKSKWKKAKEVRDMLDEYITSEDDKKAKSR